GPEVEVEGAIVGQGGVAEAADLAVRLLLAGEDQGPGAAERFPDRPGRGLERGGEDDDPLEPPLDLRQVVGHGLVRLAPAAAAGDERGVAARAFERSDADLAVGEAGEELAGAGVDQLVAEVAVDPDERQVGGLADRLEERLPPVLEPLPAHSSV